MQKRMGEIIEFAERAERMIAERDAKLTRAAAFLDRLANDIERRGFGGHAADCRAMAKKLRGKT